MIGDILFLRPDWNPVSRLVAAWTHGPYCHCEIVVSDGYSVGALSRGVVCHPMPRAAAIARTGGGLAYCDAALAWLMAQVTHPYGWWQAFDTGLNLHVKPLGHDCSGLAIAFLSLAGYPDVLSPGLSPNALAKKLSV